MTDWGYPDRERARCVAAFGQWHGPDFWKHNDDLRRYDRIIRETKPDVIIETGTNTGASASWMANVTTVHPKVITIDIDGSRWNRANDHGILRISGSSIDPYVLSAVSDLLDRWTGAGDGSTPRVMVSLDSDHSASHVLREIELYAPLVTPGCHLVVEDGILAWLSAETLREHDCRYEGTPLDAINEWQNPRGAIDDFIWNPNGFTRDLTIELSESVTMHPAGWWRRDD